MANSPRAFLSHSSQDNDRFVIPFAKRLRAKGIDAWLDYWELLPGDSLIDKIWNEGLKDCNAFLIVLSSHSIGSRWVREEMNTGVIKKIEDKTRLIPLRLDRCEVPEPLRSTIWIDIHDPAAYDCEFERVVNAIHGQYQRPPIGDNPAYIQPDALKINGLAPIDSTILECACRCAIRTEQSNILRGEQLVSDLQAKGISETQVIETQEILEARSYVKLYRVSDSTRAYDLSITTLGFDAFARSGGVENYSVVFADVARCLVRKSEMSNEAVSKALGQPIRIVEHVFESLGNSGLIRFAKLVGGGLSGLWMDVFWVSPELRRSLEANG